MSTYHEGELEMQRRAGVSELAGRVGRIVGAEIPAAAAVFLAARPFVVVATVGGSGAPRASLLAGTPGFVRAVDSRTVVIECGVGHFARPAAEATASTPGAEAVAWERVAGDLAVRDDFGLLAIDFATKRRMRLNGRAAQRGDVIAVAAAEVYSNCPQYINPSPAAITVREPWQEWVATADTFFIASVHPARGADASHRGGPRGFVRVEGQQLVWPDYSGNNMFNTLGNVIVEPRAALLFVDFASGATLELRGRASVRGDTQREVVFDVGEVIPTAAENPSGTPLPDSKATPDDRDPR